MMDDERFMTDSDGRIYRRYDDIKTKPIQRLNYDSREINRYIKKQEPVIIENLGLVDSATKWDLEYLHENIGNEEKSVYVSKTHKFMYYNASRCAVYPDFIPPNEQHNMTMTEFIRKYRTWKPGEHRIYFQQILTDTVGSCIYNDFRNFKWSWLNSKKERFNWGDLTSNLLLIGQPGNVTPVHYDEQQNFFAQVHGYKRVLLFDPKFFQCLYPYPFHHPCDRQSQVDFENPDYEKFPLAKHLAGYEGVVGPGDVLYIPMCWWHYIESTMDSQITTSINFWYKHQSMTLSDLRFPLKWQQKLTVSRNIEKMLGEALGDPSEVGPFLNALVNGRYTDQPVDISEFSI